MTDSPVVVVTFSTTTVTTADSEPDTVSSPANRATTS